MAQQEGRSAAAARGLAAMAASLALLSAAPASPDKAPFTVEPGPRTMSDEERALLPDPSIGAQHAIVLVDDTIRDDTIPRFSRHYRVKILSPLWRGIGDWEIPYEARPNIQKWWTTIIPPAGDPIEMSLDDMVPQIVARRGGAKLRVLKLALPKVSSGSIVDMGFTVRSSGDAFVRLNLQEPWPVRKLRYHWTPYQYVASQYHVRRRPELKLDITRGKRSLYLEANDLPLYVPERWAPPEDLIRATAVLHYTFRQPNSDPNAFWDSVARDEEEDIREFMKESEALKELMSQAAIPASTPLEEKLRLAYDWIGASIRNLSRATAEETEAEAAEVEMENEKKKRSAFVHHRRRGTISDILEHKEAHDDTLDRLYIAMARSLGAQAHLVMASDRVFEYWDRTLFTRHQFTDHLVALRKPGESMERAVFADPGSGLAYGVIPWRCTATKALVVTAQGAGEAILPGPQAAGNRMTTEAALSFRDDPGGVVRWTATGTGMRGWEERQTLRWAHPGERRERLDALCGSGRMEVLGAEAPGFERPVGEFSLVCDGALMMPLPASDAGRFSTSFEGPWIPDVPRLILPQRTHPLVFPYPRMDVSVVRIQAPAGFLPGRAPSPIRFSTPAGEYSLMVRQEGSSLVAERRLTLAVLSARQDRYAEIRAFLQRVRRADELPLEFLREDGS
ncbi:MAG TPA: hypothetical protein VJV23_01960 [Candidatus Polarisedimenticolia bacterium]|nr:hypothetical protein [Candidatus Polarisedimenticolia bacterium]